MPFILKINTDDEQFKESFKTRAAAVSRANAVMDAGTIVKGTRRATKASYTPYKVAVTRMPRGKVVFLRTEKLTVDAKTEEAALKTRDDVRMEEKRLWRVKEGLE